MSAEQCYTPVVVIVALFAAFHFGRESRSPYAILQSGNTVIAGSCHMVAKWSADDFGFRCKMNDKSYLREPDEP